MKKNIPPTIELVAHHEAGHALIGYLLGWFPTKITIAISSDRLPIGKTEYDYGDDRKYIEYDASKEVTGSDRENYLRVLIGMYKTMIAGPHAEARFQNGKNYNRGSVQPSEVDAQKQLFLKKKYKYYEGKDIDQGRFIEREVTTAISKNWEAIEDLANLICGSENLQIDREQISIVLSKIKK